MLAARRSLSLTQCCQRHRPLSSRGILSRAKHFTTTSTTSNAETASAAKTALVLGVTAPGKNHQDAEAVKVTNSNLKNLVSQTQHTGELGQTRIVYGVEVDGKLYDAVGLVGLGREDHHPSCNINANVNADTGKTHKSVLNPYVQRDNVRVASAKAIQSLRSTFSKSPLDIEYIPFGDTHAIAEGATLGAYTYSTTKSQQPPTIDTRLKTAFSAEKDKWAIGHVFAEAQNVARTWTETPANKMTPTIFANQVVSLLQSFDNVKCVVRDKEWVESQKMGAFLSVANGSDEPLKFLEIIYTGNQHNDAKMDIGLVGKGVTFDSGGISLKPGSGMADMRGDMMGAAIVAATVYAISKLKLPINTTACIPLTENMPSGRATKPGDVVTSRSGKTIEIDNTDAEGRLLLADALHYITSVHQPSKCIDVATLTGAMDVALGNVYTGFFTNSTSLADALVQAGQRAGDELWRMPLHPLYLDQMKSQTADIKNVGGRSGGSCTAATFLQEFLYEGEGDKENEKEKDNNESGKKGYEVEWAHLDVAGVMTSPCGILGKGMSGRPLRSILEWIVDESRSISKKV